MNDARPSSSISGESGAPSDEHRVPGAWPVYSGKSFNLWLPDTGDYYDSVDPLSITEHLQEKRLSQRRTSSSAFAELDRATTDDPATLPCRKPRIAFRDVTRATDTRTLVIGFIPPLRVVIHKAPFLLRVSGFAADEAYVLGVLSSMPCDWQARRNVELNLTFEHFNQLSIPDPGVGHPVRDRVVEIAGRLAAVDERFRDWAAEVGVPVGSANDEGVKQNLICELDACVAHLYGLDEDDLAVVYDTFSETVDYSERHAAVLAHFRKLHDRV
ncbi:MAG: hypothetical protein OXG34_07415 [bacterium]|nr:hypothetical protein [bacterium]